MAEKGELLYEEDITKHIDDLILKRKGNKRKKGNKLAFLCLFIIIFVFILLIIGPREPGLNDLKGTSLIIFFEIFILIFIFGAIAEFLKLYYLRIYERGISLSTRSFKEWLNNQEHYISFDNIKEIIFIKKLRQPVSIKIIQKNGFFEKIKRNYIINQNKIENILKDKVKIIREE